MTLEEAIKNRHSVRTYVDKPIPENIITEIQFEVDKCNAEGNLKFQLITDEPKAFGTFLAHYGKFSGVKNYIALVGKQEEGLEQKVGYYGEQLVLLLQSLGLNSCWVAVSFGKSIVKSNININKEDKLVCVIAFGYGETQGKPHTSKNFKEVSSASDDAPDWYKSGVEAALLAPTAINQQRFIFEYDGKNAVLKSIPGPYSVVDIGIVKYHFELVSGHKVIMG